jgi:hypothetical protein
MIPRSWWPVRRTTTFIPERVRAVPTGSRIVRRSPVMVPANVPACTMCASGPGVACWEICPNRHTRS